MAIDAWPSALYGKILKDGFQEITPDNTIRSQVDMGIPQTFQRGTSFPRMFNVRMFLTLSEMNSLVTFYETSLVHGTERFSMYIPRTEASSVCRFVTRPIYEPMNQGYVATFQLEVLP